MKTHVISYTRIYPYL